MASAVLKSSTGVSIAESVMTDIITRNSKYYYYLGKVLSWNPFGDDIPESPLDNYNYELKTRSQIISTKRISESDVSFVIPRINWTVNTIYDKYDDNYSSINLSYSGKSSIEESKFYVVTDDDSVYKCIGNNYNKISTIKPTGYDTDIFTTADGYVWKFLYNIPIGYKNKFYNQDYIPVTTAVRNQFYSKGTISSIIINNAGSGYVQGSTTIVVSGDGYLEENPYLLATVAFSDIGFGYSTTPLATISAPTITIGVEVQALATVSRTGTTVTSGTLTNIGYGYTDNATITIAEPFSDAIEYSNSLVVTIGQKIKYLGNYYNVTIAGFLGTLPPTHTTGTVTNGTASLAYVATRAIAYLTSTKTEAIVTPVVTLGEITSYVIVNGGVGYSYINLAVTGVGSGAILSTDLSSGDLNTLQANVELLAVSGSLSHITISNQGTVYSTASVVISGDGVGATASATISNGNIVNIVMLTYGSGYTYANASVVGNGINCVLRCIISPLGGHGKNAVLELYARTLMFFSSISSEKNQGITISNDSRQLGIIKSIDKFGSELSYNKALGSACYLLTMSTTVDPIKFYPDLKLNTGNKEYYIVSVEGKSILISSHKNDIPLIGESFISTNSDTIVPSSITPPSIDKYSGNLLFIDNRSAFSTNAEQSLSLRTTIQF